MRFVSAALRARGALSAVCSGPLGTWIKSCEGLAFPHTSFLEGTALIRLLVAETRALPAASVSEESLGGPLRLARAGPAPAPRASRGLSAHHGGRRGAGGGNGVLGMALAFSETMLLCFSTGVEGVKGLEPSPAEKPWGVGNSTNQGQNLGMGLGAAPGPCFLEA